MMNVISEILILFSFDPHTVKGRKLDVNSSEHNHVTPKILERLPTLKITSIFSKSYILAKSLYLQNYV